MAEIVLDGRYIQDHFPGIGRYVWNLVQALAAAAPQHTFRVPYDPQLANTRYPLSDLAQLANVQLLSVRAPTFSWREQLLGLNPDVTAGAALWHSAYYTEPYCKRIPTVVTLEDVIPLVADDEMPNALRRLVYRGMNRLAARTSAHVVTLSQAARADIIRFLDVPADRITAIPLGVDSRFQPAPTAEIDRVKRQLNLKRYVLYLGINKPHKNLLRLVEAWARVRTDAQLVIAGHWDQRYPEVRETVHRLGLAPSVLCRPNIAERDLVSLLSGADLFVFPSTHEGFGLPPLEAMACGVPIACSSASSLPEVVGDAALLFDPLDVNSIAAALTRALQDSTLRDSLRARGLARAQEFTWERTACETLRVYERFLTE